jgi:hypothetical protein
MYHERQRPIPPIFSPHSQPLCHLRLAKHTSSWQVHFSFCVCPASAAVQQLNENHQIYYTERHSVSTFTMLQVWRRNNMSSIPIGGDDFSLLHPRPDRLWSAHSMDIRLHIPWGKAAGAWLTVCPSLHRNNTEDCDNTTSTWAAVQAVFLGTDNPDGSFRTVRAQSKLSSWILIQVSCLHRRYFLARNLKTPVP